MIVSQKDNIRTKRIIKEIREALKFRSLKRYSVENLIKQGIFIESRKMTDDQGMKGCPKKNIIKIRRKRTKENERKETNNKSRRKKMTKEKRRETGKENAGNGNPVPGFSSDQFVFVNIPLFLFFLWFFDIFFSCGVCCLKKFPGASNVLFLCARLSFYEFF